MELVGPITFQTGTLISITHNLINVPGIYIKQLNTDFLNELIFM